MPKHPHVVLPQTVATKFEAHNCIHNKISLYAVALQLLELKGPNLFHHDAYVHKASSINT